MNILLPVIIFVAWLTASVAPAGSKAIEDAKRGVPEDKRQGTSIMPLFPVLPLMMWGIAWLINQVASPWGTWGMLWSHLAILLVSLAIIVRDIVRLKTIKMSRAEQGGGHVR